MNGCHLAGLLFSSLPLLPLLPPLRQASESVSAALRDLFSKKRTRLGRPFFEAMLRPPLALGPLLLPALLQYAAIARSEYMRGEALGLLEAALKVRC